MSNAVDITAADPSLGVNATGDQSAGNTVPPAATPQTTSTGTTHTNELPETQF